MRRISIDVNIDDDDGDSELSCNELGQADENR